MTQQVCKAQQTASLELNQQDDINKYLGGGGGRARERIQNITVALGTDGCWGMGGNGHAQQPPLYSLNEVCGRKTPVRKRITMWTWSGEENPHWKHLNSSLQL